MSEKKPKKRNALGRGLGALLDDSVVFEAPMHQGESRNMSEIVLDQIGVNPFQPRANFDQETLKELADSIRTQGIIQPITVRKLSAGKYQLIAGERRLQASKLAGLKRIPAYIRTANDQEMLEMALIENIQRENLNAIEIAVSYQRLLSECHLKQEELGDRVGKNRTTVTNYLRLLKLPPDIQIGIRDKKISMGHARALINIENIDTQLNLYQQIIRDDLSVRKVEALVRKNVSGSREKEKPQTGTENNAAMNQLKQKLSSHFGSRIQIKADEKCRGEIRIPFVSTDDLNRILEILDF
ncbi:MAG: chromosome partitioning protein ParB [Cyclobacteriaceae bacterium]|nr:MAG: chromosome partitioning protein ParB [Cyclobacteriaceae bacterium]